MMSALGTTKAQIAESAQVDRSAFAREHRHALAVGEHEAILSVAEFLHKATWRGDITAPNDFLKCRGGGRWNDSPPSRTIEYVSPKYRDEAASRPQVPAGSHWTGQLASSLHEGQR